MVCEAARWLEAYGFVATCRTMNRANRPFPPPCTIGRMAPGTTRDPFSLDITGLGDETRVVRFRGREACSELWRFDVVIASTSHGGPDPAAFLAQLNGARATLAISGRDGPARRLHGVVSKVRAVASEWGGDTRWYEVRLRPPLWLLKKRRNYRVFQDADVNAVVSEILAEHGVAHSWRTERAYAIRPYWVQYGESDYRFVERLLADEGISYFFEDASASEAAERATLVLADGARGLRPISGEAALPFRPQGAANGAQLEGEALHAFAPGLALAPTAVVSRHYDPERPRVELGSRAAVSGGAPELERYDHRFEQGRGEVAADAATRRLAQERRAHAVARATGGCRRMAPGRTFRLVDHPAGCDGEYLVVGVEHRGEQAHASAPASDRVYDNDVACLSTPRALAPKVPKRRVRQVVESAVVTGPPGEEIHVDELGRVQVKFHWDRGASARDKTSCWLRVAQPWAGSAWGAQFIPRVGMEVLVSFVGGDTDHPVVIGALYNAANPLPFALPKHKTQSGIRTSSSPGGERANELRFEDAAGSEQILVHAARDLDEVVERHHTRTVHGGERLAVTEARTLTVGGDVLRVVGGNDVATVHGNQVLHVVGRQLVQVDGTSTDGDGGVVARAPEPEAPTPAPSPEYSRMVDEAELRDAALVLAVAHAPPRLAAAAVELDRAARQWRDGAAALRAEALALRRSLGLLVRRAVRPNTEFLDLGAVFTASKQAERLTERLRGHAAEVAQRRAELAARPIDGLEPAALALHGLAEQQREEATWLADCVASDLSELREVYGRQGGRRGGRGSGGGGAATSWQNVPELSFLGPPDSDGIRHGVTHPNGSRMAISGGGEIDSPDGFRVAAKGCFFELSDGTLTLHGARVDIQAGEVNIHGGVVTVTGTPIKLN
jgi:type VI secretion system VgrG family protein